MSAVSNGAQWASRRKTTSMVVNTLAIVVAVATILAIARLSPTAAASDYILMPRSQLLSLPMSGAAWSALKARADSSIGTPDISNQDESADQTTFAKSLVFARTGIASYRTSVIAALKAAVGTESGGRTLAAARNLPGYVLAADFIDLGSADASFDSNTFRPWLRRVLTEDLSGKTLISTQEGRPNNWAPTRVPRERPSRAISVIRPSWLGPRKCSVVGSATGPRTRVSRTEISAGSALPVSPSASIRRA